jgi:hypothetical protein
MASTTSRIVGRDRLRMAVSAAVVLAALTAGTAGTAAPGPAGSAAELTLLGTATALIPNPAARRPGSW